MVYFPSIMSFVQSVEANLVGEVCRGFNVPNSEGSFFAGLMSANFGTAGQSAGWHTASAYWSLRYTTEWDVIPVVKT